MSGTAITVLWRIASVQRKRKGYRVGKIYVLFLYVTGSAAHKKLVEMLTRPRLIAAIRKLSKYHQTSGLEAKHAMENVLASKNTYFSYHSLSAR